MTTTRATATPSAGQRRYMQIAEALRSRLEAGVWRRGQTLPAIPLLMAEFGVAAVTVRQALATLEAQGLVRKRRGIGTTVERDIAATRWITLPTSLAQLVDTVNTVRPKVLNLEHGATLPDVPLPAGAVPGPSYVRMRRLHLHDEQPYCLIDLALATELYRRAPAKFRRRPVLSVLDEIARRRIASARQELTLRGADLAEAQHLQVALGAPVAEVRRTLTDAKGEVLYAAIVVYPSRTVRLEMDLLHPGAPALSRP